MHPQASWLSVALLPGDSHRPRFECRSWIDKGGVCSLLLFFVLLFLFSFSFSTCTGGCIVSWSVCPLKLDSPCSQNNLGAPSFPYISYSPLSLLSIKPSHSFFSSCFFFSPQMGLSILHRSPWVTHMNHCDVPLKVCVWLGGGRWKISYFCIKLKEYIFLSENLEKTKGNV